MRFLLLLFLLTNLASCRRDPDIVAPQTIDFRDSVTGNYYSIRTWYQTTMWGSSSGTDTLMVTVFKDPGSSDTILIAKTRNNIVDTSKFGIDTSYEYHLTNSFAVNNLEFNLSQDSIHWSQGYFSPGSSYFEEYLGKK